MQEEKELKLQRKMQILHNLKKELNSSVSLKISEENMIAFMKQNIEEKKEKVEQVKKMQVKVKSFRSCGRKHSRAETIMECDKLIPVMQVKNSRRRRSNINIK